MGYCFRSPSLAVCLFAAICLRTASDSVSHQLGIKVLASATTLSPSFISSCCCLPTTSSSRRRARPYFPITFRTFPHTFPCEFSTGASVFTSISLKLFKELQNYIIIEVLSPESGMHQLVLSSTSFQQPNRVKSRIHVHRNITTACCSD